MYKKLILLIAIFFYCSSLASAAELWSFTGFVNKYKLYRSYNCNIEKDTECPNELSWQGKTIGFKFNLGKKDIHATYRFNFTPYYVMTPIIAKVYSKLDNKHQSTVHVTNPGTYSVELSGRQLRKGANTIYLEVPSLQCGYGQPARGFILSSISLERFKKAPQSDPIL